MTHADRARECMEEIRSKDCDPDFGRDLIAALIYNVERETVERAIIAVCGVIHMETGDYGDLCDRVVQGIRAAFGERELP